MTSQRFVYIWTYQVSPDHRSEFLAAYSSIGEWAQLFSRDPSYLGTKLLQDSVDDDRFSTIDYWVSKADRDSFRKRYSNEFNALDERCEAFTLQEAFVGDFVEMNDSDT